MRYILCFLLLNIVTFSLCDTDEQKMIHFAESLKNEGDLYRAITEYKRANSYFPESSNKSANFLRIAECYEEGEHFQEAMNFYKITLKLMPDNWEAKYKIAYLHFKMYEYDLSEEFISNQITINTTQKDSLLLLSSLNSVYQMKFEEAEITLNKVKENPKAHRYLKILNENTPLKKKNRNLAALIGTLFPGGGYFYVGRPQTGFAALLVNSMMIYGAVESFDNNHNEAGYTFSVFAFSFHSGSIFGSMQSADKYNKTQYNNLLNSFN